MDIELALALEENAKLEAQIEQLTYLHNEDVSTIKLLNKQIADLEKQIEELRTDNIEWEKASDKWKVLYLDLKKQIEKMKDCSNCKYKYIQDNADLGEGTRTDPCLSCRSHNMWEFDD